MIKKNLKINNKMTTSKKPIKKVLDKVNQKKVKSVKPIAKQVNLTTELSKIGSAYVEAITGKIKFSKVKEMLKKLHKDVKKSAKK